MSELLLNAYCTNVNVQFYLERATVVCSEFMLLM